MNQKIAILLSFLLIVGNVLADDGIFQIKISNHLFYPDTLIVPAGIRVKLLIENQDATPEEFESFELNREKIIMGKTTATVFIGPLKPGTYPFFGEFNPETAQGKIIAASPDKP
jgi:hypothetical protein